MRTTLDVLHKECESVSAAVLALTEDAFERPTRCIGWDVATLLAHLCRDMDWVSIGLAASPPSAVDSHAVDYWRRYDRTANALQTTRRARQIAASYPSRAELARAWDTTWRCALEAATPIDPERPMQTWGPRLTLAEFLKTRVLELVVHGMDLADALDRPPWASGVGLQMAGDLLAGLLGRDPSGELGCDRVTALEKATGRRPLSDADLDRLGPLAQRFPLLS